LYYGQGRAQESFGPAAEAGGDTDAHAGDHRPASTTVRHVASSIWSSVTGRTLSRSSDGRQAPATKGFEVRRPPRPPGV
jgi:hypothetical protein